MEVQRKKLSRSNPKKKTRRVYSKSVASKVATLAKQVKSITKAVEWKRQYFNTVEWQATTDAGGVPLSDTTFAPGYIEVPYSGAYVNVTGFLTSLQAQSLYNNLSGSPVGFYTGDAIAGSKITPKYMEFSVRLSPWPRSGLYPNSAETPSNIYQLGPMSPVRVIAVQCRNAGFTQISNKITGYASNDETIRKLLFGEYQKCIVNTVISSPTYVTDLPLDKEFGGKGKDFHVLVDDVINPTGPMVFAADQLTEHEIALQPEIAKTYRIQGSDLSVVSFENSTIMPTDFMNVTTTGASYGYDAGDIMIFLLSDNLISQSWTDFNPRRTFAKVQGYLSFTDV